LKINENVLINRVTAFADTSISTRSSAIADKLRAAIADKLRALFCKVVEVLQDFFSENVDKKFTTDYNVA